MEEEYLVTSLKIDKDLNTRLNMYCGRNGYKKQKLITRIIEEFLKSEGQKDEIKNV